MAYCTTRSARCSTAWGIVSPRALAVLRLMTSLKENMVLCLECYAGKPGAPFGVKLKDQVLVTAEKARLICTYPYDAKLLD